MRDGEMTGKEAFLFRHGGSLLGTTFHVWFIYPLTHFIAEDVARFLYDAAQNPIATDLQVHFVQEITEDIDPEEEFDDPLEGFFEKTGF